jgi:Cu-processing system ATP-binding protein
MISIDNLTKRFGQLYALNSVGVALESGKAYALIGPNGSGKTTLIKSILGLVVPTAGKICFLGKDISHDPDYRQHIGYMPQIGRYPDHMRIGDVIAMMADVRQTKNGLDEELVEAFKLHKLFHKRMHTLSGGTRQKVSAVLAFLFRPAALILDEPTAGLDPLAAEILKEKIISERQKGKLIIITSHILSELDELTSDVIYMCDGILQYQDSIAQLKKETGEARLAKAIAGLITQRQLLATLTN